MTTDFDAGQFRRALGSFTTGVTVVTTVGLQGEDFSGNSDTHGEAFLWGWVWDGRREGGAGRAPGQSRSTRALSSLPTLKNGSFLSVTRIGSPVLGLRPM